MIIRFFRTFYRAICETVNHDGVEHAGYMAFITILAMFPFLVFLMAICGFVGQSALGKELVQLLFNNMPEHIVFALKPRVEEIISGPPQGLLTIAIIGAIWTASSAVEGMRTILNRIYRVSSPPAYIWRRLLSIVQFILLTLVLLGSTLLLVIVPTFLQQFSTTIAIDLGLHPFWDYLRYIIAGVLMVGAVSWLYYMIPNVSLKLRSVLPGALLVVMGWTISAYLLSTYTLNFRQVNLIYGGLQGVIVSLIFFYLINIIFIFGAEFNYHSTKR